MARRPDVMPDGRQLSLGLFPFRNRNLLSQHWLEQRLPLEPEWRERAESAQEALAALRRLWSVEADRVELYGNEAGLEHGLIQPVLRILGWHLKTQAYLDGREPDYALFSDDADLETALRAGRHSPDFWRPAAMVADAKAWHVSLDRPSRVSGRREYPPEQIEWYLDRSLCDFGVITNGRLWRLVPRELGPGKPRFQTYLEVDLPQLLARLPTGDGELGYLPSGAAFDDFMRFFLLFGRDGAVGPAGRRPLLARAVQGSSEYSVGVGEELKDRVFEALRLTVEGFVSHPPNELDPETDLAGCQEESLRLLYRILFVLYAEDRGLLPYRTNRTYTNNRSLARRRDEIAGRLDQVAQGIRAADYDRASTALWDDLTDLFDLVDGGHRTYGVQAYNGGLFDPEANAFLSAKALPDWHLARVIDQLGRAPQSGRPAFELFRVDYRDLAIQQLGSVYEGLLELRPRYAASDMLVARAADGRRELVLPADQPLPQGHAATGTTYRRGTVYLSTDKGERRRTGSYYTPDHIVAHIVETTLGARCGEIDAELNAEIAAKREAIGRAAADGDRIRLEAELAILERSYDRRVLALKVLDPAMGSGHFLIQACRFLAEDIATNPHTGDVAVDADVGDEPTIVHWKRRVAESCLHGVDLNQMAVELAKLALWLETVASDAPLTFLDHHLRHGDSVVGARIRDMGSLPGDRGMLTGQFDEALRAGLPGLLAPLDTIAGIASASVEEVHSKEEVFRRQFLPVQRRFTALGDLWVRAAMLPREVDRGAYRQLVGALGAPRTFDRLLGAVTDSPEGTVSAPTVPFHWELAFPHVFLRPDRARGFDVIVGNPPYEVISSAETDRDAEPLKRYVARDASLAASLVGKNNLYKVLIARSIELLADGGYLGFIVPMALLGDAQARGIRALMLSEGAFRSVDAFPQKDDAGRRVFPDAKLSTAVFLYRRSLDAQARAASFPTRSHPGRFVENDAVPLRLNANSITFYDPANLTILSCGQTDWDLLQTLDAGRFGRLGDHVEFFQGEVNETVARRKGQLTTPERGRLVVRGACICLYQVRDASQGEDIFLDVAAFTRDAASDTKKGHHRHERVVLQESSPQNNFRRIIAARLPAGEFCNHTVNYTTSARSLFDLRLVLFVLNSAFAEWYFRLGSTNAHVSQYQLDMIPCPRFGSGDRTVDEALSSAILRDLRGPTFEAAADRLVALARAGVSATLEATVASLVDRIEQEEGARGAITRAQRARLAPEGAKAQELLDRVLLELIGFGAGLATIRERLGAMP